MLPPSGPKKQTQNKPNPLQRNRPFSESSLFFLER